MIRKLLFIVLLVAMLMTLAHAQTDLTTPTATGSGNTISWNAVSEDARSGYQIRWQSSNDRTGRFKLASNEHSYTFRDMPYGVTYTVQVKALSGRSGTRDSRWSRSVSLLRVRSATPVPTAKPVVKNLAPPQNVRKTAQHAFAWDAVTGASRYIVRWAESGSGNWIVHKINNSRTFSFAIPGLSSHKDYQVQVQANGDGTNYQWNGPWSAALTLRRIPPTATPVPQYETRQSVQTRVERCRHNGKDGDCTYTKTCDWFCEISSPGAACVDDLSSKGCGDWILASVAYDATPTPSPAPSRNRGGGGSDDDDDDDNGGNGVTQPKPVCVPKETCSRGKSYISGWQVQVDIGGVCVYEIWERTLRSVSCSDGCGGSRSYVERVGGDRLAGHRRCS